MFDWIPPLPESSALPSTVPDKSLDFSTNQWTGYVTKEDFDSNGNFVSLGPAPPGLISGLEGLMLIGLFRKLSETPHGQTVLRDVMVKYLSTIGSVIGNIYHAGSQNWLNGLVGNRVAVDIYARLGLMSPRDAMQERAWIDHQVGEMLSVQRLGMGLDAVTTMISTSGSKETYGEGLEESGKGLGAMAGLLKAMK